MPAKVGVLLSGCGVFDGAEIHESVSILIALDRRGAQALCMAPDAPLEEIDHVSRKPTGAKRGVLAESARIARGRIRDLKTVRVEEIDALILPGGFGAARNLCSFAADGADCRVHPQVESLLLAVRAAGKPIGLACIAPVIAARVFGAHGFSPRVSVGTDKGVADAIRSMNAVHVDVGPADICVDERNLLVTTPCYMNDVGPWTVFQGAEKMVEEVLRLAQRR